MFIIKTKGIFFIQGMEEIRGKIEGKRELHFIRTLFEDKKAQSPSYR